MKNIAQIEYSRHRSFNNFVTNVLSADALGRRDDSDAQAAEHAGQLVGAHIDAQAGLDEIPAIVYGADLPADLAV